MELELSELLNKVVKLTIFDGGRFSGRLAEIDDKYIKIVFRSGLFAYVAISDISFIAPVRLQPEVVV